MHGDHSGSPRRDDRQHGDQPGQPLGHPAPLPDIKVAGGSFAEQSPFTEQLPAFGEQSAPEGQPPRFGEQLPFEQRPGSGEQPVFDGQPPMFGEQPSFGEQIPFEQRPGSGEQPVFDGQPSMFGERSAFGGQPPSSGQPPAFGEQPSYEQPGRGSRRRLPVKLVAVVAGAAVVVGGGAVAAVAMTGSDGGGKSTVKPGTVAADAERQPDLQAMEAQRRQQNLDRANRAARKDAGKPPALQAKGTPPTKKPEAGGGIPTGGDAVPSGEAQRIARTMLPSFGFDPKTQFSCLVNLWNRESGWRTTAANPSGAYGIPQALPGSKMASAGSDWRTSARTQIKWGLGYIKGRYKTPCGAWGHFQSRGWY